MGKIDKIETVSDDKEIDMLHHCAGTNQRFSMSPEMLGRVLERLDAAEAKVSILQTANDNIAAALHEVEDQRDALQAVVDKLPKCWRLNEDGKLVQDCPVVPDMQLWRMSGPGGVIGEARTIRSFDISHTDAFSDYYSSLEAAKAAFALASHPATEDEG